MALSIGFEVANIEVSFSNFKTVHKKLTRFTNIPTSGFYSITIPNDIVEIAAGIGTNYSGLTKVTFGSGIRIFRENIFQNCYDLEEIELTNQIDYALKENTNVSSTNPLYGITTLGGNVIEGESYYIFLSDSIILNKDNNKYPFNNCPKLYKVTTYSHFSPLLLSSYYSLFNGTTKNQISVAVVNGLKTIYDIFYNFTSLTSVIINNPENVSEIFNNAFQNVPAKNFNLENMTNLKQILGSAFSNSGITSVTIPSRVTKITEVVFSNCVSLTSVTINATYNPYFFVNNDDFTNSNNFSGSYNINTVSLKNIYNFIDKQTAFFKRIGMSAKQAFATEIPLSVALAAGYNQTELDSVYRIVLNISDNVLTNIIVLSTTNVTIPAGVIAISVTACQNKTFIGSLSIPSTVTRILADSFLGCNNLTSLTLPGSRTSNSIPLIPLDSNSFALVTTPSLTRSNVNVNSLQQLRTQGYTVAQLEAAGFQNVPVTCFGENTRIMCFIDGQEQELMVQDIRNGVLVKTLGSGYKPVCMIGTNKMMNLGNDERVEERLYICKKENYTELTEDLIITGCHSVLVNDITEEQKNKIMNKFGRIMVTEGKYRLTAAMDERANPYNCDREFNIYHFALEHDIYTYNYGVYANGLLVESCSKRYLTEIANMILL
jgi:hypothetical protein